ncbi:hypothetical protein [Enterovibrio nigricans]|uniref:Phage shock protein B n=1 Tax=Enterovibrio nigricans DSM 22720 TaxID=1121868 RepID=A0A1T4VNZ2_9GAMM|nr:hypothetical protein [Enterovibrio nigricans]PKF49452.1 hypothetical protein AT251_18680 [Enterovibrio nigricans]SKA66702.1 hypothetical protein SAMN02745132_04134 [Enterovibrio nigricans DSM 22720]
MDVFLFIVVVVAVGAGTKTIKSYFDYRTALNAFEANHKKHERENLLNEISALKLRVEVLEKLVTDEGYELNRKIKAL